MAKRKAKQPTAVTLQPIATWPELDLAELFGWADNEIAAVLQFPDISDVVQWPELTLEWPDISDVVQPSKWDETGAISSKVELP